MMKPCVLKHRKKCAFKNEKLDIKPKIGKKYKKQNITFSEPDSL